MTTEIQTIVDRFVSELQELFRKERAAAERSLADAIGQAMGERPEDPPSPIWLFRRKGGELLPAQKRATAGKPARKTQTPALAAARKLQGRYLGLLRSAKGRRRQQAKKIAAGSGVKAAIAHLMSGAQAHGA